MRPHGVQIYVSLINTSFQPIPIVVITAGAIIIESYMNIFHMLFHVRLTQSFVKALLTIQIIGIATYSSNTGQDPLSFFLHPGL